MKHALTLAALTFAAAPALAQAQGYVRVQDAKLPFSVDLPKGWVGLKTNDGLAGITAASAAKPPAAMIRLIFIPKNGKTVNLPVELAAFEKSVQADGTKLSRLTEKSVAYGGVSGIERTYNMTIKGQAYKMRLWFGNGAKNFYSFQHINTTAGYAKTDPAFTRALTSLKFR
ncbi:hypothetical protein [Deinococcus maricopensis]|uniref:PsbP C-terminal domain-containing protein n=1 Tax=Deinococcus maricopensis (strain DSM 21211 / LMG 22137 / NRRL B-23946 / LB-34) TaxID=709986 RepID=E8U7P7_DEIML|nr:hypothetical protein [Deinococcus maricopensis]ADV67086.1 hypothetical protein Deima_1437 [Deinococcus maricopensis DSM 21211]